MDKNELNAQLVMKRNVQNPINLLKPLFYQIKM
jgi:hypothetical protein